MVLVMRCYYLYCILPCNISVKFFYLTKVNTLTTHILMVKVAYNTRVDEDLIKKFKVLAIMQSKRQNDLLEEAIRDLLTKYNKKDDNKINRK